jgi:hypothetical protein
MTYYVFFFLIHLQKGVLDSQPQVIKFTNCLPMVGGSLRVLRFSTTKTGRHDIAEILLKVALNTINQIKSNQILIHNTRREIPWFIYFAQMRSQSWFSELNWERF